MTITLAVIPARGGSKGVKGKNLRVVLGKSLIQHSVDVAKATRSIDRVVVSTDNDAIANEARGAGAEVPFLRPAELAGDTTPMLPVLQHAVETCEKLWGETVATVVLLHPTSPLRTAEDVEAALALLRSSGADAVISARPARRSPHFNMMMQDGDWARLVIPDPKVGRRQDAPPVYDLDTSIWIYSRAALMTERARIPRRTRVYVIPEERSSDLDTELDFEMLEALARIRAEKEAKR